MPISTVSPAAAFCRVAFVVVLGVLTAVAGPAAMAEEKSDQVVEKLIGEFDQLLAQGKGQQALQHLDRVQRQHGEHPLVMATVGRVQMMQNKVDAAVQSLNQALEKQPHHPQATALLAQIDFSMGRGDQAQKRIDEALALHPNNVELLLIAAQIKMAQRDFEKAEPIYRKILKNEKLQPAIAAQAQAQLGMTLVQQKKHAEAAEALSEAARLQWHPDLAMALVMQLELAGEVEKTSEAIRDFENKLLNPQLAPIREKANAQLVPIKRRMALKRIEAQLEQGENFKARLNIDYFNKETSKDPAAWKEFGPQAKRLEIIERTQTLAENLEKKFGVDMLQLVVSQLNTLTADQQGEHVDKALALIKQAQQVIDETQAREVPAVLELVKAGKTIADLEYPDKDLKALLEEKGIKPYRELSAAAKKALKEHFEPLAEARQPAPFESHVLAYLEDPGNASLRTAVIDSFMKVAAGFDARSEDADYQQLIANRVWPTPGKFGPNFPKAVIDRRENAYTAWDSFKSTELREAGRWDELVKGYDRLVSIYPRREILINRAQSYFHGGNYEAAGQDLALSAAISLVEVAYSYRASAADLGLPKHALENLDHAQSLLALAQGKRIEQGPGQNAALIDVLEDINNKRWIEVAEYLGVEHPKGSIDAWLASQLRWSRQDYSDAILDALGDAAWATNDPERQASLIKLAEPLGTYKHPAFAMILSRDAENDEKRESALRTALYNRPYHVAGAVAFAQLLEKQGKSREALLAYNIAARGLSIAKIKEADRKAAATERDRLANQLKGQGTEWDFYLALLNEYQGNMYAKKNDALLAAQVEALCNRMLELNAKPASVLAVRSDAFRNMKKWQAAINDLQSIIELEPQHQHLTLIYSLIGEYQANLGQPEQAMAYLTKAIDQGHRTAAAFSQRGDLHRSAGNTQAALADFTVALEIEPEDTYCLTQRSEIYEYELLDYDKALADLKKLEELLKKAGRSTTVVSMRILSVTKHLLDRSFLR